MTDQQKTYYITNMINYLFEGGHIKTYVYHVSILFIYFKDNEEYELSDIEVKYLLDHKILIHNSKEIILNSDWRYNLNINLYENLPELIKLYTALKRDIIITDIIDN